MPEGYAARLLQADEARKAFPLVSLAYPQVTLSGWCAFVRRANRGARRRQGLVVIADRRDVIHAVYAYRLGVDLGSLGALRISDITLGCLPGRGLPQALVASIDALAAGLGSHTVLVDLPEGGGLAGVDRPVLEAAGFRVSGVRLARVGPARIGLSPQRIAEQALQSMLRSLATSVQRPRLP